mgnify:CR=1 FL=1
MSLFYSYVRRIEANQELVLDVVRIYLGFGLFFRGAALLVTENGLQQLAGGAATSLPLSGVAMYVATAHLVGGAMLAVGWHTRIAALIQLPILGGAVFLVHWQGGLLSANQSFEFSALVLFLLFIVLVFGGGQWSLDARRDG